MPTIPTRVLTEPLDLHPGPGNLSVPTRKEITALYGDAHQAPLIHRLRDQLEALNLDRPIRRCPHRINLDAAGCGTCLAQGVL